MKINLVNKTHWRDDHIKAFIQRIAKDERPDLCKRGGKTLTCKVVYTRNRGCGSSGYAYYHSNLMTVRLPKQNPDKVDFAHVIAHELAHTRGVRHRDMTGLSRYQRVGRYREIYAWADQLPLEITPKKVKAKPTTDAKLLHAEKMLKAAMTREKRAVTLRKKWESKVKYYAKKVAEPPKAPKPPTLPKPEPKLPDSLRGWSQGDFEVKNYGGGEYEVFAKDGHNFGDGTHSRLCSGLREARELMRQFQGLVTPCNSDCDCQE